MLRHAPSGNCDLRLEVPNDIILPLKDAIAATPGGQSTLLESGIHHSQRPDMAIA